MSPANFHRHEIKMSRSVTKSKPLALEAGKLLKSSPVRNLDVVLRVG